jgi:hypothetical protein
MTRRNPWTLTLLLLPLLACKADDPGETDGDVTDGTGDTTNSSTPTTGEPMDCSMIPEIAAIDESSCEPLATDFQPRTDAAGDMWDACAGDQIPYQQVDAKTPGSAARIVAYEEMAKLLWNNANEPTAADFTAARDQYVIAEGLESRLNRREDLHYPPIPMAEWDPQVDGDKQCTVAALAAKYTDRCVGPDAMKPIIDQAFADGQSGTGDPRVNAAKIHATLEWFLYLSVYKEANTCATEAPADCDSAWAYYSGMEPITSGLGLSKDVLAGSQNAHERIWDGLLAARCWRDLAKDDMGNYPFLEMTTPLLQDLFELAWEQLDQALHRGYAVVVRDNAEAFLNTLCGTGDLYQPAAWAYLQISLNALVREANERDPAQGKIIADVAASTSPTAQDIADAIAAIDAVIPCP